MILFDTQRRAVAAAHAARDRMRRTETNLAGQPLWTEGEILALRGHWPDRASVAKLLPTRTPKAIENKAHRLQLTTPRRIWTAADLRTIRPRYPTDEPVNSIGEVVSKTKHQVWNKASKVRLKRPRRRPKASADPLVHAIRQRAFDLRIPLHGLDRDVRQGPYFVKVNPPLNRLAVMRAVRILGGHFSVRFPE